MAFAKRIQPDAWQDSTTLPVRPLFAPIDQVLASGGDPRLTLSRPSRRNIYGCTPHPQSGLIDFASSTASSISEEAYARVQKARDLFLADMIAKGSANAFEACLDNQRRALLAHLELEDSGTEIVFCASGTDAQIQALFLVKSLLGTPLTTVIAGADQTGSGTIYTARGRHFSERAAGGQDVVRGRAIAGLADEVRSIAIPFQLPDGDFRGAAEMDKAVLDAVAETANQDGNVLLQSMDASKFGWRAPGDSCLNEIARRWPGQVQIVADACQMRLSRARLKALLDRECIVLITGSKYFTGPAFSGALLVPRNLSVRAAAIAEAPEGLAAYTSCFDWPRSWAIRSRFAPVPNWGQWLRWEAALEEMRLYFAVPDDFRAKARTFLAGHARALVAAAPDLQLLPGGPDAQAQTIAAFVPCKDGAPLSLADCHSLYRALHRTGCKIGQPVALAQGAALRIALSARAIRQCWSDDPVRAEARLAREAAKLSALIEKLEFLLRNAPEPAAP